MQEKLNLCFLVQAHSENAKLDTDKSIELLMQIEGCLDERSMYYKWHNNTFKERLEGIKELTIH